MIMTRSIIQDHLQNDKYSRFTRFPIWDGIGPDRALSSSTVQIQVKIKIQAHIQIQTYGYVVNTQE